MNESTTLTLNQQDEVSLFGDWKNYPRKQLPKLPNYFASEFLTTHNKAIIIGGRSSNYPRTFKCLKLHHGSWKEHSTFNEERICASAITTDIATFIFGGTFHDRSYEYLPNDSTSWKIGESEIPIEFQQGCAMYIPSDKYIWLLGSSWNMRSIIKFDMYAHTFQVLPLQLKEGRYQHRCIVIPGTKNILITGGRTTGRSYLNPTEILDTENEVIVSGPPMNQSRAEHGIGIINIKGRERIVVFGGIGTNARRCLDSVEVYDTKTQKWTLTNLKMKKAGVFKANLCVKGKTISDAMKY